MLRVHKPSNRIEKRPLQKWDRNRLPPLNERAAGVDRAVHRIEVRCTGQSPERLARHRPNPLFRPTTWSSFRTVKCGCQTPSDNEPIRSKATIRRRPVAARKEDARRNENRCVSTSLARPTCWTILCRRPSVVCIRGQRLRQSRDQIESTISGRSIADQALTRMSAGSKKKGIRD